MQAHMLAKRGLGTVEFIIIALVIGLVILALYLVFAGKGFGALSSAESCKGRGGTCIDATAVCGTNIPVETTTSDCQRTGTSPKKCCVPLGR